MMDVPAPPPPPAPSADIEAVIAGETVWLLPEKAIYHKNSNAVFIADTHFGKTATFRKFGIPAPEGGLADDLERIDAALDRHGADRLIILGDFFHAQEARSTATLDGLRAWRERRSTLRVDLALGNHDYVAGPPPADLRIHVLSYDERTLGPFWLDHFPRASTNGHTLCGHLHPAVRLRDRGGSFTVPCFYCGPDYTILPAFGTFTGHKKVSVEPGARVYPVIDDEVIALPPRLFDKTA